MGGKLNFDPVPRFGLPRNMTVRFMVLGGLGARGIGFTL
jgi:hypothetical protein